MTSALSRGVCEGLSQLPSLQSRPGLSRVSPFSHSGRRRQQAEPQRAGRALPAELSTPHRTGAPAPPPTSADRLIKDMSSQPRVFYRVTSFITSLVTGNDVYLIYPSCRIFWVFVFFFLLPHLASRGVPYSSIPLCAETEEKRHRRATPAPRSHRQPRTPSPRGGFASKPRARVRWRVNLRIAV